MSENITLSVRVTPNASKERIGEKRLLPSGEEQVMVYVNAPPEDGKANEAVLRLLAKHFNVSRSQVSLIKGELNRNKVVRIEL